MKMSTLQERLASVRDDNPKGQQGVVARIAQEMIYLSGQTSPELQWKREAEERDL